MGNSAFILLVEQSTTTEVTLDQVHEKLKRYINMTTKTGQQLDWDYAGAAFPYTISDNKEGDTRWLRLQGNDTELYNHLIIGVGSHAKDENEEEETTEQHYIQVVLPERATHGDSNKANEFCKYLAKEFQAQLRLFNGRLMYYYPRKP